MSVQQLTEKFLFLSPDIADCLAEGLINRSSLARLISDAYELDSPDAASAATRRIPSLEKLSSERKLLPRNSFSFEETQLRAHVIQWNTQSTFRAVRDSLIKESRFQLLYSELSASTEGHRIIVVEPFERQPDPASFADLTSQPGIDITTQETYLCQIRTDLPKLQAFRQLLELMKTAQITPLFARTADDTFEARVDPAAFLKFKALIGAELS